MCHGCGILLSKSTYKLHNVVLVLYFQESKELSSLKAELTARGINLYAIVLESFGHKEFQKYFDGTIYLDKKVIQFPDHYINA